MTGQPAGRPRDVMVIGSGRSGTSMVAGLPRIEAAIGARLDSEMAETALRRSPDTDRCPQAIQAFYGELCAAAGYSPG